MPQRSPLLILLLAILLLGTIPTRAQQPDSLSTPYAQPYSWRVTTPPNWHRLAVNTAVLTAAYGATLGVLALLPDDATAWNSEQYQHSTFARRWWDNVMVKNPHLDNDNAIFNYILHPYAGAAYYMSARSNGFNFFQSLLYSAFVSTVEWEFGAEAGMERPSYQDILITPLSGPIIGEGFYCIKRHIVNHGYTLLGSRLLGGTVAFVCDPVNEFINLFRGSPERRLHTTRALTLTSAPTLIAGTPGLTLHAEF